MADTSIEWTRGDDGSAGKVWNCLENKGLTLLFKGNADIFDGPAHGGGTPHADRFTTSFSQRNVMPRKPTSPRASRQSREANPNWRGGRSVTPDGYVLIRVGTDHHLADVRGYAYEHRLVAEQMLGRRLKPGEEVHHGPGGRQDNRPDNLTVMASKAEHRKEHRRSGKPLRDPGEPNPIIACACGCGKTFTRYDETGRPRKYVSGHNP